jgi:hypothetical protein
MLLAENPPGDWIRVKANRDVVATAFFHLQTPRVASADDRQLFMGLAQRDGTEAWMGGLIRPAGFSRNLQFLARPMESTGKWSGAEIYYEVNERLQFTRVDAPEKVAELKRAAEPTVDYATDAASIVVTDGDGRRWRLPKSGTQDSGVREVVSERYLAHFDGTFYEIPRHGDRTEPDFQHMKPVASHRMRIADFCTWRGLLVLAGTRPIASPDGHFFRAADSAAGLWFGAVDDLYKLGAPIGEGGPWKNTAVNAGAPSDPYLMTNFGRKSVTLEHDRDEPVRFTIDVDFLADGSWVRYGVVEVPAGQPVTHAFPEGFAAHWVRITSDHSAQVTAWFKYE